MSRHVCQSTAPPIAALMLAVLISAITGCAPATIEEAHPVWPPPPAEARILHLKNVRSISDLAKPSAFDGFIQMLTGGRQLALLRPHDAAVWADRYLFVTDQEQQAVVVFNLKTAKASLITQVGGTFLVSPVGVAVCGEWIAVSDSALNRVYLLTPKGKLIKTIVKPEGFARPTGLAYDSATGLLYVVDTLANEVCVFNLSSGEMVRRFGSRGQGRGQFNFPTHVCVGPAGRIYVTDSLNFRVQVFDGQGNYLFHIGQLGDASGHLAVPKGVGVDSQGHIYVVDSYFSRIQIFNANGVFLLAIGEPGEDSGGFQVPAGLTIDSRNRIYVCDSYNERIQLLQFAGVPDDEIPSESP